MIQNDNDNIRYEKNKSGNEATEETVGGDRNYQKSKYDDLKNAIADAYNKTPIPKLFLTLTMVIYGVIVYSKKEKGIEINDLSLFIFFVLFIIFVFCTLTISAHIYRDFIKNKTNKFSINNLKSYLKSSNKKLFISFILFLSIISLIIVFKFRIVDLIRNFIGVFIGS